VTVLAALLAGCSSDSKPKPPQPGSPEFNWLAAKAAFTKGEYDKANGLFSQLAHGTSPFAENARPLALMTSLSLASANMELSEKYLEGSKKTRGNVAPYMRSSGAYKSKTTSAAMQFIEEARRFSEVNQDKEVTLVLPMPEGDKSDPPQYKKITTGLPVPASEIPGIEKAVVARELIKNMSLTLGEAKDLEKARAKYQNNEAKAKGADVLLTVAKGLYAVSEMFAPKKLAQPNRIISAVYEEALKDLKMVKDNKEARELEKKIIAAQKKLGAS
jgi:hypothetical protein